MASVQDRADEHRSLSDDDHRLLAELLTGRSDRRVAYYLSTSDRTVRRRISGLMRRFGAANRFSLGVILGQLGLVQIKLPQPGPAGGEYPARDLSR